MKNFEFKHDGKSYWYSRGIVCISYIFATDKDDNLYVLANKRGSGVSDTNKWNCPCGHLDFDESCKDCAIRETFEETGVDISKCRLQLYTINDKDFDSSDQSISFHYYVNITNKTIDELIPNKSHMETNEVSEAKWINVDEIDNYDWAFNHDNRIKQVIKRMYFDD